jgi:hypothetical protein
MVAALRSSVLRTWYTYWYPRRNPKPVEVTIATSVEENSLIMEDVSTLPWYLVAGYANQSSIMIYFSHHENKRSLSFGTEIRKWDLYYLQLA